MSTSASTDSVMFRTASTDNVFCRRLPGDAGSFTRAFRTCTTFALGKMLSASIARSRFALSGFSTSRRKLTSRSASAMPDRLAIDASRTAGSSSFSARTLRRSRTSGSSNRPRSSAARRRTSADVSSAAANRTSSRSSADRSRPSQYAGAAVNLGLSLRSAHWTRKRVWASSRIS